MHEVRYFSGERALAVCLAVFGGGFAVLFLVAFGPRHFSLTWSYQQFVVYSLMFVVAASYAVVARNSWLFDHGTGKILRRDRNFLGTTTRVHANFAACTKVRLLQIAYGEAPDAWHLEIPLAGRPSILITESAQLGCCPHALYSQARTLSRILNVPLEYLPLWQRSLP